MDSSEHSGASHSEQAPQVPFGLAGIASARMIGRYAVVKSLGRGGMGEVYKAADSENNRHVAIKTIESESQQDADMLSRFEHEARAAMALDHPNVAKIYGMEYDSRGQPFIVMEFIEGEPLDHYARGGTELPFSRSVDLIIQAARGLESAHRRSIIHRDIKPSNLLVTGDFKIKIIDFGLAKSLWDRTFLTATGMVVGTPRYISPEQAMGRPVDHRSDIYSLGVTFYELVTHQCPFEGDTPMAVMMKHVNSPLMPPYMLNPKVPADINEIICKMMAKDPGERYQEYEPLIRDLESAKIHRLAKEKHLPVSALPNMESAETVLIGQAVQPGQRSSYMTEGLVHVEFSNKDLLPPPPKWKLILLTLLGILILGTAVAILLQAREAEKKGEMSWIAQRIQALVKPKETPEPEKTEDIVKADEANIALTRARMEAALIKIVEYRQNKGRYPMMRELRAEHLISTSESQDAWGHDLVVDTITGTILAFGRDGIERTADDFEVGPGRTPRIPKPLTPEDVTISKQIKD
jgi:serine/threonine protein kinase